MKVNEEIFVTDIGMRERCLARTDVLDSVKELFLIPTIECATLPQVARYFGVADNSVRQVYKRNRAEFEQDGAGLRPVSDFTSLNGTNCTIQSITQVRGTAHIVFKDGAELLVSNRGVTSFPKRAVLRMAMLLRDSDVAREVRTQLLNIFEGTSQEQKVAAIDEEKVLLNNIGEAFGSGDITKVIEATQALDGYRKRYIDKLNREKSMLAAQAYSWTNGSSLTRAVRLFAGEMGLNFAKAYDMLYTELLYKHGINLKARGDKPYTQWIKDGEYRFVFQTLAALCEINGLNTDEIFSKAKISLD